MPGRGFRGGFGGRRAFGGRSRAVGRSSGRSRSRTARRSGSSRSSARGVVTYSIYNSGGKRTYIGSTNNPERRAAEHARDGRLTRGGGAGGGVQANVPGGCPATGGKEDPGLQAQDGEASEAQQNV